jgi:serralysin
MKKSHLPFDDVWTIAAQEADNGPAMPAAHGAADDTLIFDEGEPDVTAADAAGSVDTLVTSAAKPVASIATLADYLVNGFWQCNNTIAHHWASSTITYNITGLNSA